MFKSNNNNNKENTIKVEASELKNPSEAWLFFLSGIAEKKNEVKTFFLLLCGDYVYSIFSSTWEWIIILIADRMG